MSQRAVAVLIGHKTFWSLKLRLRQKKDLRVRQGVAVFPENALTLDDLLEKARDRLNSSVPSSSASVAVVEQAMIGNA